MKTIIVTVELLNGWDDLNLEPVATMLEERVESALDSIAPSEADHRARAVLAEG